jgi:hypothetical protein
MTPEQRREQHRKYRLAKFAPMFSVERDAAENKLAPAEIHHQNIGKWSLE